MGTLEKNLKEFVAKEKKQKIKQVRCYEKSTQVLTKHFRKFKFRTAFLYGLNRWYSRREAARVPEQARRQGCPGCSHVPHHGVRPRGQGRGPVRHGARPVAGEAELREARGCPPRGGRAGRPLPDRLHRGRVPRGAGGGNQEGFHLRLSAEAHRQGGGRLAL